MCDYVVKVEFTSVSEYFIYSLTLDIVIFLWVKNNTAMRSK